MEKVITKQQWLDAIDECMKQEKYGKLINCTLCNKISSEGGVACSSCICNDYATSCYNFFHPPYIVQPCSYIMGSVYPYLTNSELVKFWMPKYVRPVLNKMRKWVEEN